MRFGKSVVVGGVVLLALSVTACAGPNSPAAPGASATHSTGFAPAPSASLTAVPATVIGPKGVGALVVGMSKQQARETGQAAGITGDSGTCGGADDGRLLGAQPAAPDDLDGKLFFSRSTGRLVIIAATAEVSTPQGIHIGSSYKDVKKAYPSWRGRNGKSGSGLVTVPGDPKLRYRIYVDAGQVMELTVQTADQDCGG